jgi:hypothetical protein
MPPIAIPTGSNTNGNTTASGSIPAAPLASPGKNTYYCIKT